MKTYTASQARARLAEVLDLAESGQTVFIERGRVRFQLGIQRPARRRARHKPLIEILDPAVQDGQWTWEWEAGGLKFVPRPRRR